jgi:hypothetical protein
MLRSSCDERTLAALAARLENVAALFFSAQLAALDPESTGSCRGYRGSATLGAAVIGVGGKPNIHVTSRHLGFEIEGRAAQSQAWQGRVEQNGG